VKGVSLGGSGGATLAQADDSQLSGWPGVRTEPAGHNDSSALAGRAPTVPAAANAMPSPAAIATRPPTSGFLDQALVRTSRDKGRRVQGRGFQANSASAEHSYGGRRHHKYQLMQCWHLNGGELTVL
jgi:hypothetical protein